MSYHFTRSPRFTIFTCFTLTYNSKDDKTYVNGVGKQIETLTKLMEETDKKIKVSVWRCVYSQVTLECQEAQQALEDPVPL